MSSDPRDALREPQMQLFHLRAVLGRLTPRDMSFEQCLHLCSDSEGLVNKAVVHTAPHDSWGSSDMHSSTGKAFPDVKWVGQMPAKTMHSSHRLWWVKPEVGAGQWVNCDTWTSFHPLAGSLRYK